MLVMKQLDVLSIKTCCANRHTGTLPSVDRGTAVKRGLCLTEWCLLLKYISLGEHWTPVAAVGSVLLVVGIFLRFEGKTELCLSSNQKRRQAPLGLVNGACRKCGGTLIRLNGI